MTLDTVVAQTDLRQQGNIGPVSTVWTLTKVNLSLVWQRAMSKVLLAILLGIFAVIVGFLVLAYEATSNEAASNFTECGTRAQQTTQCQPEPDSVLQARKQQSLNALGSLVTFPNDLALVGGYVGAMGVLLISILGGQLVGSEYGLGTLRLSLARGLSRAQLLAGQVIALAIISLITTFGMLVVGLLVGVTVGPAIGTTVPNLTAEGVRELLFYGLALSLTLFLYTQIALFFATLGRSAAAGIGAAIGTIFLEIVVTVVFAIVGGLVGGDWGTRIGHIPDWFPNSNASAIVTHVSDAPIGLNDVTPTTLDLTHALLVVAAYLVVLIGGSYVLFRTRDMTD